MGPPDRRSRNSKESPSIPAGFFRYTPGLPNLGRLNLTAYDTSRFHRLMNLNDPPDARLRHQLPELTESIVATYTPDDAINHLGFCPLPSDEGVVAILRDIRDILYPGYRGTAGLTRTNIRYHVGSIIDRVYGVLATEIERALRHEDRLTTGLETCDAASGGSSQANRTDKDYAIKGGELALAILRMIPELRITLATDVKAAFDGDPAVTSTDEVVFCYPGIDAITVYRIAHAMHRLGVPFIPRMMTEWAHRETGIDIHPGATIGDYFFIDHGTGVVIGGTCEIGRHVKLYQGVTLGALSFPTDSDGQLIRGAKRHPTIEDHVVVYANATILGGRTTVGHHSVIGSSVWITRTVSPHTTVVLEKPELKVRGPKIDAETLAGPVDFQI